MNDIEIITHKIGVLTSMYATLNQETDPNTAEKASELQKKIIEKLESLIQAL